MNIAFPAVKVKWVSPDDDWNHFYLIGVDYHGMVVLKGRDDDDGNKHDGGVFRVLAEEIKSMKFVQWHRRNEVD